MQFHTLLAEQYMRVHGVSHYQLELEHLRIAAGGQLQVMAGSEALVFCHTESGTQVEQQLLHLKIESPNDLFDLNAYPQPSHGLVHTGQVTISNLSPVSLTLVWLRIRPLWYLRAGKDSISIAS